MSKLIVDLEGKVVEKNVGQIYNNKMYFNKDSEYLLLEFLQFSNNPSFLDCDWFMKIDGMVERIVDYCMEKRCLDLEKVYMKISDAELNKFSYGSVQRQLQLFELAKMRALNVLQRNCQKVRPSISYVIGFLIYYNLV